MKTALTLLLLAIAISPALRAETLCGPGTITIPTNQAIIINTVRTNVPGPNMATDTRLSVDPDNFIYFFTGAIQNPRFAIAGPRTLMFTNYWSGSPDLVVTFQRVKSSAIKTIMCAGNQPNVVNVPAGKTIQFFDFLGNGNVIITIQPTNSADTFTLFNSFNSGPVLYSRPSATGPATITVSSGSPTLVSYYFIPARTARTPVELLY